MLGDRVESFGGNSGLYGGNTGLYGGNREMGGLGSVSSLIGDECKLEGFTVVSSPTSRLSFCPRSPPAPRRRPKSSYLTIKQTGPFYLTFLFKIILSPIVILIYL